MSGIEKCFRSQGKLEVKIEECDSLPTEESTSLPQQNVSIGQTRTTLSKPPQVEHTPWPLSSRSAESNRGQKNKVRRQEDKTTAHTTTQYRRQWQDLSGWRDWNNARPPPRKQHVSALGQEDPPHHAHVLETRPVLDDHFTIRTEVWINTAPHVCFSARARIEQSQWHEIFGPHHNLHFNRPKSFGLEGHWNIVVQPSH